MGVENLEKLFAPKRIAVIGASNRDGSVGAKLLRNLVGVGYGGTVYPVNSFSPVVQGITAYPNVAKIPRQVDLAIVATPAHTVPQIVEECGKAGVPALVIISAGFREAGDEGSRLERRIQRVRKQYQMRIVGPNSFGIIRPEVNLNATFANKTASQGKIAFISQSAALCASVLDWASEAHVGFSAITSIGSMIDVDFGDLIDYFGTDPKTRSIVLYIESIKNAKKFMSAARGFARAKPIVVVKAGRFRESAEAAICHTGALCGEDAVYDAAFKRAGVVRVEAIGDLFSCAETLAMQPNPKGPNLTIITNAGGPGIMATDALISKDGGLTPLDEKTINSLGQILPPYCSRLNPIDVLEEATTERFRKVMEICFKDPNSDGFLVIYTPQGASDPVETAMAIVELSKKVSKPILTALMGEDECRKARSVLRKNGVPSFTTPEQAVSTFIYMWSYTQNLDLLYETPEELLPQQSIPSSLSQMFHKALKENREVLTGLESQQFLEAYEIPVVQSRMARDPEEAERISSDIGFPVVMKLLSPQIPHKWRVEGVALNIHSVSEAREHYMELKRRFKKTEPKAKFEGVLLQPMLSRDGYELFMGAKQDKQFGSVIMFGLGGVNVEALKEVSIGFPPLNQVLARRLLEETVLPKVISNREGPPLNLGLVEEILVKFSRLVVDFPEIKEIDVNPIIAKGNTAVAVDASIVVDKRRLKAKRGLRDRLVITPYPVKYSSHWKLKDGKSVILRAVKPEDESLLQELFQSLSEETMRFRFFQIIKELTHENLTRYCNIDYNREIAMIANVMKGKKERTIGVARLIVQPGRKRGEFAVVVGDQWQGLGLGSKLVDSIVEIAKDIKLERIIGDVLSENKKMVQLCTKKGFIMRQTEKDTLTAILDL